jgi:tetratricopeptide (TPR) repeat protein
MGEAHFQMGDTLFRLGETDTALDSLRTSLKHEPGNLDAELLLANIYFKKGMKAPALTILDRITEQHKGSVYAYAARSIAKSIRSGCSYYELFLLNKNEHNCFICHPEKEFYCNFSKLFLSGAKTIK